MANSILHPLQSYTDQKNSSHPITDKGEMKRQEIIYELIHTERNHYRSLKIMQKIYIGQMRKELKFPKQKCARFFPDLEEMLQISNELLKRLQKRQKDQNPIVHHIGQVQFLASSYDNLYQKVLSNDY